MKILMTGATGLIGRELGKKLFNDGHQLVVVTRSQKKAQLVLPFPAQVIEHDLVHSSLKAEDFQGVDAVIHLMGETIDGRWTEQKKKQIVDSRAVSAKNLLKNISTQVQVILTASGVGYYGDRDDQILTEDSSMGEGFLAKVCESWEKEFINQHRRTVVFRLGAVMSSQGGALKKLIQLFQKQIGAQISDGQAWLSFVSLFDVVNAFSLALTDKNYRGVFNLSTEYPIQNKDWTPLLVKALGVLQLPPVPKWAIRSLYGEMADLVLFSNRVLPEKLKTVGFRFQYNHFQELIQDELKDWSQGRGVYQSEQYIDAPIEKVFTFFSEANNLEKITPPFLNFKIKSVSTPQIQEGTLIQYSLLVHKIPLRWLTEIIDWQPPYQFVDQQLKGPYRLWHHTHQFKKMGLGTLMSDRVRYQLPVPALTGLAVRSFVESDIQKIFDYRRKVIAQTQF